MFKKNVKAPNSLLNQEQILTILGEDFEFEGTIRSKGNARIEGKIIGDVIVKNGVILGEKGTIEGNLETDTAIIFGTVNGNIKVKHLEIKETGYINGDVKTENILVDLGGKYNGQLDMKNGTEKQNEQNPELASQKGKAQKKNENTILNNMNF